MKFTHKCTIIFFVLISISCGLFGTHTVRKGEKYLISFKNEAYVFIVMNIQHERSDTTLIEGIDYKLYQRGKEDNEVFNSFTKYHRIKKNENSYFLKRIEGTSQILRGEMSFTWSYANSDHIYVYLSDGAQIKRIS